MYFGQFENTCSSAIVTPSSLVNASPLRRIRRRVLGSIASPPTGLFSAPASGSPGNGWAAMVTLSGVGVAMKPGGP